MGDVPLQSNIDSASKDLFAAPPPEPSRRGLILGAAGVILLLLIVAAFALERAKHKPASALNTQLPADPYAASLQISQLAMSQSTSLSGATSTFLDGHIKNTGSKTITAATIQVNFANDMALPSDVETLPLSLIRTREPYIDTEALTSDPLKPGEDKEFRLIFESIPANWNQQMPAIHVVGVSP